MGVLHRDVKPANFLMSQSGPGATVKLADFGLSTFYTRGRLEKEAVGSPFYMAPEMVMRGSPGYGPAADIWSCGVILFQFLSRDLPFKVRTGIELQQESGGARRSIFTELHEVGAANYGG